jgi:hypothetical protein
MDYSIEHVRGLKDLAIKYELANCEILSKYSDEELANIYNGLGSDSFPKLIREILTGTNKELEPVALIHDVEWNDADGKWESFTASNDRFKANGKKIAKKKFSFFNPNRYYVILKAETFGNLCQQYGWKAWITP